MTTDLMRDFESPKHAVEEELHEVSIEEEIGKVHSLVSEMDKNGYSLITIPIKQYLEISTDDKGNFNPLRLEYLKKLTNRIYYGEYIKSVENKNEVANLIEKDPAKRNFFRIIFKGASYHGINTIEFSRIADSIWRTSEIGIGYTTTCSSDPPWLVYSSNEKWKKRTGYGHRFSNRRCTVEERKAEIQGIDALLIFTDRVHENGECHSYELQFDSKDKADKFAEFLYAQENIELSPEEKLNFLKDRDKSLILWDRIDIIDPKYAILSYNYKYKWFLESNGNEGKWDEFLKKNMISENDFMNSVLDYQKLLEEKLRLMTDDAVQKAMMGKNRSDFRTGIKGSWDYMDYKRKARVKVIDWNMVKNVIGETFEKEIIAMAKEKSRTNMSPDSCVT